MRIKEMPRHLFLGSLTVGASLIEGLLSFSGMYALWPVLPVALSSVALLELYEGEIYLKNLKGALKKLSTKNYTENYLARKYMEKIVRTVDCQNLPSFLQTYLEVSAELKQLKKQKIQDKETKKEIKEKLRAMEQLLAKKMFDFDLNHINRDEKKLKTLLQSNASLDLEELNRWLAAHGRKSMREKLAKNRAILRVMSLLCVAGSGLMFIGTAYLLLEAITTIPFFMTLPLAAIPAIVLPMALISAVAYGFLTYNLMVDFINEETLEHWITKIKRLSQEGFSVRSALQGLTAISLIGLTLAMTFCTAGTWWTIAKNTRSLSELLRIPAFVMEIFNPVMVGIFSLITSLQNATATLTLLGLFSKNPQQQRSFSEYLQDSFQNIKKSFLELWKRENVLQLLNPFRLLLVGTFTPVRILLFLGHLVSMGVTTDRVPRVPEKVSIGLSILFEGLSDLSYFFSSPEEESAEHDHDLPMRVLRLFFLPLIGLTKLWDLAAINIGHLFNHEPSKKMVTAMETNADKSISETSFIVHPTSNYTHITVSPTSDEEEKVDRGIHSPRSFSFREQPRGLTLFESNQNRDYPDNIYFKDNDDLNLSLS